MKRHHYFTTLSLSATTSIAAHHHDAVAAFLTVLFDHLFRLVVEMSGGGVV